MQYGRVEEKEREIYEERERADYIILYRFVSVSIDAVVHFHDDS